MIRENKLIRFDWAMKTILRNKANFDILNGFLSALLKEDIKIESLLESESNKDSQEQKLNRVDLIARNGNGEHIIIEVQVQRELDYLKRILWGVSKTIVESINIGEEYNKIVKVISVSILYFDIGNSEDYIYYGTTEFYRNEQ